MDKSIKDIKVNVGPMGINDFFPDISNVTLHEIQCYSCIAGDQGLQNHAMSIRKYNECISGTIKHSVYYPLGYLTIEDVSIFKDVKFETCFKIEELRHGNFIFVYCGSIEYTDTVIFRLFGGDGGYDPYNYYTSIINTFLPVLDKLTITNDDYKFVLPTNKISTEYKQEDWFMLDNNYRIKLKIPISNKYESEVLQNFINVLKEDTKMYSLDNVKPGENIVVRKKEDTQIPVLRDCEEYQVVKVNPNTITLKVLGENILTLNGVHFIDGDVFTVVKDEFLYHYDIVDIVKEEIILPNVEGYGSYIIKIGVDGGFRGVKNEKYVLYDLNAIDSKGYWELRYLGKTRIIGHSLFELLGTRHSNYNYSYHEANVTILDFFKNTDVPSLPVISPFSKNEDGKYTVGKNYNKILNYGTIDLIDSN